MKRSNFLFGGQTHDKQTTVFGYFKFQEAGPDAGCGMGAMVG